MQKNILLGNVFRFYGPLATWINAVVDFTTKLDFYVPKSLTPKPQANLGVRNLQPYCKADEP